MASDFLRRFVCTKPDHQKTGPPQNRTTNNIGPLEVLECFGVRFLAAIGRPPTARAVGGADMHTYINVWHGRRDDIHWEDARNEGSEFGISYCIYVVVDLRIFQLILKLMSVATTVRSFM